MPWWRIRRYLRFAPEIAWRDFWAPIFNAGQFLTFLAAVVGLVIVLRTASDSIRDEQAASWAISIEASLAAAVIWAFASIVRAPFVAWAEERKRGRWRGNRLIYFEPQLIFVERCKGVPHIQQFRVRVKDAERDAFIHYEIDVADEAKRFLGGTFTGHIVTSNSLKRGGIALRGGTLLDEKGDGTFILNLPEGAMSQTVRIYMLDQSVGNPDDRDGIAGDESPLTARQLS